MRLFVALELPESVRRSIGAWQAQAMRRHPPARWVDRAQLHVTLRFLSDVTAQSLQALSHRLREAVAACVAPRLQVVAAGTFPPGGRARVLWLGVQATGDLAGLQTRVAGAAESILGLEPEDRPFHPHVTVGRCRRPWPRPAVEAFLKQSPAAFGEAFVADSAVLVRSELAAAGARHTVLETFPLEVAPT